MGEVLLGLRSRSLRSTGSIFNFLGQIVHADQVGRESFPLYDESGLSTGPKRWLPCRLNQPARVHCKPIIDVRGNGLVQLVSVSYAGSLYSVPGDIEISYSPDVFTILKQLIALNLSAKNLPTTAILSVTLNP